MNARSLGKKRRPLYHTLLIYPVRMISQIFIRVSFLPSSLFPHLYLAPA